MSDLPLGDWLLLALLCVPVVATLLSLLKSDHWVMRIFDFPRLQIAALSVLCMLLNYWLEQSSNAIFDFMEVVNFVCAVWQFWQISAYTRLRKKQVMGYQGEDNNRTVSILASNVLTTNRQADKLLLLVRQYRPDVVLTLESDQWWENALAELETDHPYTVKVPLDNLYGMHLYSRLPLHDAQVKYRVRDDIPSITAKVELPSGELIRIYCLHPMPPSPTESETSTERDGELLLVGKEIAASDESCMVFGDLNDVAWSDTSRLFQRISGLLDPRIGRGLYNTFHADWKLLRWPLDHIFHSNDFLVADLKVLPHIGSDHFPIYGKFQYHPPAEHVHETPESDHGDKHEAADKIEAAMELQN
ncbi:endonuclease/exonuclease/phosphatase family protein [Neisseria sp. CCUG17229]|uniref:endonuclease/exonuclease/phosphatase family protein n=1 Tax=Neisseria sp. CCUG17229 TaxID=3392036 RepID=UPI003A0FD00A